MKSDLILLLRKLKNPWIWILFFRVAKIWQSGLPYLWRIWRYNFKIDVRWWAKYQLKLPCIQILSGNSSRIMHSQTPSVRRTKTFSQLCIAESLWEIRKRLMEEEFIKRPFFHTLPLPLNVNGCAKESLDKNQRSRGSAEGGGGTARGHPPSGGQRHHGGGHGGSERRHCHRSQERQHLAN